MRLPLGQSAAIGRHYIDIGELTIAILRTIDAGWSLALGREEMSDSADEVTMTECLRDSMRQALVDHRLPWRKTMIVAPGSESRSRAGMVSPDGRTDIPLYLTRVFARSGEHDPHAIIECKRVSDGDTALARDYVIEGIDRFRNGKYAENHAKGFMIGYVLSGSESGVVDGINMYLVGRTRTTELLSATQIDGITNGWISEHVRPPGSPAIILHHAMLPVRFAGAPAQPLNA